MIRWCLTEVFGLWLEFPLLDSHFFSRCSRTKSRVFSNCSNIFTHEIGEHYPQIGNTPNFGYLHESLAVLPRKSENISQLGIFFSHDHYSPCASGKEASETQGGAQLNRQLGWVVMYNGRFPFPRATLLGLTEKNCGIGCFFFLRSPNKKPEMVCVFVYTENFGH